MAGLKSIEEDRTFKCVQNDESIDLNDLTPIHLNNYLYWQPLSYTPRDVNKTTTMLTFTVSPTSKKAITIPAGFRVSNPNGSIIFYTQTDAVIQANQSSIGSVEARSESETMAAANTINQIKSAFSEKGITLSVANPAESTKHRVNSTEIPDEIRITAEQANDRNIVADSSVTAGVYECIAPDYDIRKEKATVANKQVPLCFKRSIEIQLTDGRTQVVYPWRKKWRRKGN